MPRAKCLLCNEWDDDIMNHLRLMHPDHYSEQGKHDGDGGVAIEDEEKDR